MVSDPIDRLLLGGAGRIRAIEIEFSDPAAFAAAARLLDADPTTTAHVASGYADGIEVVLVLEGAPPDYLTGR